MEYLFLGQSTIIADLKEKINDQEVKKLFSLIGKADSIGARKKYLIVNNMNKKEQWMVGLLAILLVIFALVSLYLNVFQTKQPSTIAKPAVKDESIKINNTLKTSVTVLPAPGTK